MTSTALDKETVTPYDSLIVSAGAFTSYFGHEEYSHDAPGLKSIDDALEVRGRIFNAFEYAELEEDPEIRKEWMTFVIVGAGATGVELAGQIKELSRRTLRRNYRDIDTTEARVVLLDALGTVLGSFGSKLSAAGAERLEKMGVEIWLNGRVVGVDETGLDVQDDQGRVERIPARTAIWAAGVRASSLGKQLGEQTGADVDRSGRVAVKEDLTLPGHPEVFVIGDMMSLNNYPGVSQVAMQGGKYAAESIKRSIKNKAAQGPFHYFDKGSMATISRFNAVAQIGRFHFSGFIAWLLWLGVHLFYLIGFKNRVTTLMHWFVTFVGRGRSEQTRTHQQQIARRAMSQLEIGHLGTPPAVGSSTSAPPRGGAPSGGAPTGHGSGEDVESTPTISLPAVAS